jgi:hypothetical protein
MENVLYIVVPALFVLMTAYMLLSKMLQNNERQRIFELRKSNQNVITPIRLRAYERLMLLIERTHPEKLMLNTYKPAMTVLELQTAFTASLRQEFAHNTAQQIYVSAELWDTISKVEQTLLKLINLVAAKCEPTADGIVLAQGVISIYDQQETNPTNYASQMLKQEVQMNLGM